MNEEDVAEAWDRNAAWWANDVSAGYDLYRELYTWPAFSAFLPPVEGLNLIDLGCGEGTNTRRLAEAGAHLTGIDLSARMIEQARAAEAGAALGIAYEVTSYTRLDMFPAETFDGAVSTMALMDGPDYEAAMRAAHRVIRPGGFLAFSILHPCFMTPGFRWLVTEEGTHEGLRVARYFDAKPFVEEWRFSRRPEPLTVTPFAVPRFPRTMSDYLNPLAEAGFRLVRTAEPRPDEAIARDNPWLKRWYDHAPLVLFVLAERT